MATLDASIEEILTRGDQGHIVIWGPLGAGDDGAAISFVGSTRRTVQVVGTFAANATLLIEGSNDGTNFSVLSDPHGNQLEFRSSGISTVGDLTRYIRPRTSAGDPQATVTMLLRKTEAR